MTPRYNTHGVGFRSLSLVIGGPQFLCEGAFFFLVVVDESAGNAQLDTFLVSLGARGGSV